MKKALKTVPYFIIILFFFFLFICLYVAHKNAYQFVYNEIQSVPDYTFLQNDGRFKSDVNYVKNVPGKYITQFAIVCYNFPELKEKNIMLEFDKIPTTMQARPTNNILIGERKYKIIINNDENFEGIHFDDIPFNAQIGIISHEFCHILDYTQKTYIEVIGTGVAYISDDEKREYEREIDLLTIKKGMGYQLRDWAQYAMFESKATDEYKQFKKEFYLNPYEIDSIIEKMKTESQIYN